MKIGVFDSGIGGLSVAKAIEKALPHDEVIFVNDNKHVPYGNKSPDIVLGFVIPILKQLEEQGCAVIVIACNTVTTQHIEKLRAIISVPLVGIEPMIKPAAAKTKTGKIAVCATPATLHSKRYAWLKKTYASNVEVIEPDCSNWAYMIENNSLNEELLRAQIEAVCDQGADVIVLGCTHYHWIEEDLNQIVKERAIILQPEQPIIARLKKILDRD